MRPRLSASLMALALATGLVAAPVASAVEAPEDLVISEYVEGSSNNKALEIFNGTDTPIDLGDHVLEVYFNGNNSPQTFDLAGTVAAGDVFVFAHSSADPDILVEANQTTGAGLWNGNDAIVLRDGADVVDSFGRVGTDPGDQWGSGATGTQNNTLRRKPPVCTGDTDTGDPFDPADEWQPFGEDTFDGLGAHSVDCDAGDPGDPGGQPRLSELRIDQPGGDDDEYVEIEGPEGTDLVGLTLVAIGDGSGGSGVVESVVDLDGTVGASNAYVVAEDTFTLSTPDQVANLNFENSDNVTHLLVDGFTGSNGDDLDTDDDGTLDSTPWSELVDAVGLVETPDGGEQYYGAALGFEDVGPDGSFVPGHAYRDTAGAWTIGEFSLGETDTPGVVPNDPFAQPEPECDATDITLISDVQGDGDTSPLAGDPVFEPGDPITVRAVVTLVAPDLGGFFVQEEPEDVDDDPATSEGVFVAGAAPADASAASTVEVTGGVSENFDRTQVNADEVAVCDVAPVEIAPTALALPADTTERETLEGMVVETAQDLFVSALFTAYSFGELGLALDGPLTQPTSAFAPDDPQAQELADDNSESLLFVNDRDEFGFQNAPWFHDVLRRAGDVVEAGVVGALNFSFGDFLVEPLGAFPEIVQVEERPSAPALGEGNDIGAFNVLNYFNTFGDSAVLRGARNQAQFDLQSAKIVQAILELDTAVLGLIELENDYEDHYDGDPSTVPSVQTLVEQLNAAAGAGTYDWIVPPEPVLTDEGLGGGGLGTDAIAQGIIYQPERVTPVGQAATFDIDALLEGEDTEKNRWPLAQSFQVDGQIVTVVVNHFKSKGSSCEDVDGPTFDPGDDDGTFLTGNCNLTREYAARRLVEWAADRPTGVGTDQTFLVGDFNSYEEEGPIEILVDAGYEDLVQSRGDDASTFKFDGRYGRLDYVFASSSASDIVEDAEVWQANSPEPYGYLYFNDPVETPESATAYASSDHDPVVVSIEPRSRSGGRGPGR